MDEDQSTEVAVFKANISKQMIKYLKKVGRKSGKNWSQGMSTNQLSRKQSTVCQGRQQEFKNA